MEGTLAQLQREILSLQFETNEEKGCLAIKQKLSQQCHCLWGFFHYKSVILYILFLEGMMESLIKSE